MATIAERRERIPSAMQQVKQWMVCGKDKAPINIGILMETGIPYRAAKDDQSQWRSFGDALFCIEEYPELDLYPMWINNPSDNIVIIDLDRKRELSPEAMQFQEKVLQWALDNTYVELSMSGKGFHIIFQGRLAADINQGRTCGFEAYSNHGAVALTGNVVSKVIDSFVNEDGQFCAYLDKMFQNSEHQTIVENYQSLNQDVVNNRHPEVLAADMAFVNRMSQFSNRDRFMGWWQGVDTGPDGRGGSENDLALLQCILKFMPQYVNDFIDETALRIFMLSPRAGKLGRKGNALPQYIMRTLSIAKQFVANDAAKLGQIPDRLAVQSYLTPQLQKQGASITTLPGINLPPQLLQRNYGGIDSSELLSEPPIEWLVKKILERESVNMVFGDSGCGKSFLMLDLMYAVAQGIDWFGIQTTQTHSAYVALEGGGAMRERVLAYTGGSTEVPRGVDVIRESFNLCDPICVDEFIRQRKAKERTGGLVVIDTFAQATAGANENDTGEMTAVTAVARRIARELKACVIVVHHCRKPDKDGHNNGYRGSSVLFADFDTVLEVGVDEETGVKYVLAKKVRNGKDGGKFPFELKPMLIETLIDRDGSPEPIFSLKVVQTDGSDHIKEGDGVESGVNNAAVVPGVGSGQKRPWASDGGERKRVGRPGFDMVNAIVQVLTAAGGSLTRKELINAVHQFLNPNVDATDRSFKKSFENGMDQAVRVRKLVDNVPQGGITHFSVIVR